MAEHQARRAALTPPSHRDGAAGCLQQRFYPYPVNGISARPFLSAGRSKQGGHDLVKDHAIGGELAHAVNHASLGINRADFVAITQIFQAGLVAIASISLLVSGIDSAQNANTAASIALLKARP